MTQQSTASRFRTWITGDTGFTMPSTGTVVVLIIGYAIFWTSYAVIVHGYEALHHDMMEAFVWGQHPQWGYYKHPPFWAWVTTLWFAVFPTINASYYALCLVISATGLLGCWSLAGCFASGERRVAAVLMLALTPFYSFGALQHNANTIFIALWPWTAYAFCRSIAGDGLWRGRASAIAFGLLSGAMLLSKYSALMMLIACFFSAIAHPNRKRYFSSALPAIVVVVAFICVAPHVVWLVENDFLPLNYVEGRTDNSFFFALQKAFEHVLGAIGQNILVIGCVVFAIRLMPRASRAEMMARLRAPMVAPLAILALGPFLLMELAGLIATIKLSTNLTVGLFGFLPLLLLTPVSDGSVKLLLPVLKRLVLIVLAAIALIAPFIGPLLMTPTHWAAIQPRAELAREVTTLWRAETDRPLTIIAGDEPYVSAVSFYSPDHPSEWIGFNARFAPWITEERVGKDGVLVVCVKGNAACEEDAVTHAKGNLLRFERTLAHSYRGVSGPEATFSIFIRAPRGVVTP